ncbi:MAG: hypothetical protein WCO09_01765 [bacterium]
MAKVYQIAEYWSGEFAFYLTLVAKSGVEAKKYLEKKANATACRTGAPRTSSFGPAHLTLENEPDAYFKAKNEVDSEFGRDVIQVRID